MKLRSLWLFYRERWVSLFFNITIILIFAAAIIIAIRQPTYGASITLHYNRFYGIDQVGSWIWMWVYWLAIVAMTFINFSLSYRVYTRDKYMSYYLQVAACITAVGFLIYLLLIGPFL